MEVQKAGDNSTQVQASVINVYNGISEERASLILHGAQNLGKIGKLLFFKLQFH